MLTVHKVSGKDMKRILAALLLLTLAAPAWGQDFEKGMQAYEQRDYETALRELRPFAEQGLAGAQHILGVMYDHGFGVLQDDRQAVKWYRKAAEQGIAGAQLNLGLQYYFGRGVPRDYAEAVRWMWKAADQGDPGAQINLNGMYDKGVQAIKQRDYATALRVLRPLAEQGNVRAQSIVGAMYHKGEGVPQDYAEAVKWFRKAAEQGFADAQSNLGAMYRKGRGVPQDYAEAVKWFRLAAEQGDVRARSLLGTMYQKGQGVPQDYAEAVKWYRKAAEKGFAEAQWLLAFMYQHGLGVPQDHAEAVKWFRLAAEQGNVSAQSTLGAYYFNGGGVPQDYAKAVKWYRKAAEQGDADAQHALGYMYHEGQSMPQDYVQAHMWFNLAAANGNKDAARNRDIAAKRMTPEQIAEAQRLAREWFQAKLEQPQTLQQTAPSKPTKQTESIKEPSTSSRRSEQMPESFKHWNISEIPGVIRYTTSGSNVAGHKFGFVKQEGRCEVDILWISWSSYDPEVHQLKGSEVRFAMNVDGTAFEIGVDLRATSNLIPVLSVAVFSNFVAGPNLVKLLKRGRTIKIDIVGPSGAVKRFDVSSDTFNLNGYIASRLRAKELCEGLEHGG